MNSWLQSKEKLHKKIIDLQGQVDATKARIQQYQQVEIRLLERVKELGCFHALSQLMEPPEIALEDFLISAATLIPPAYWHPENTCARITYKDLSFESEAFQPSQWQQTADILASEQKLGHIEVYVNTFNQHDHPEPFLSEENALLILFARNVGQYLTNRETEDKLKQIEWMLKRKPQEMADILPDYGDLTALNQEGLILSLVSKEQLADIASEFIDLLETSVAIYESNGDYALGLFSSGWCRLMDHASRRLCHTADNAEALSSGQWLCHESCWTDASLQAIQTGQPADIVCNGGIRIFSAPVLVQGEVKGAINFGYGDPPWDEEKLLELAEHYQIPFETLREQACAYQSRPNFIIDYAKKRLLIAASNLGVMIERFQSERDLFESRESLRAIIEESPLAIMSIDLQGHVLSWNPSAERMFDWKEDQVLGRFLPTISQAQRDDFNLLLSDFEKGESVSQIEVERTRKDGSTIMVNLSTATIRNTQGDITAIVGILDDVTDLKQQAEELRTTSENLQAILDHSPLLISEISLEGQFLRGNQALANLLNSQPEDLAGKHFSELLPPTTVQQFMSRIALVSKILKPITVEDHLEFSDGQRTFLTTLFPLYNLDGQIRSIGSISHDITERKTAEEQIKSMKTELEKEVREKTIQLQDRVLELENFYETTIEREFRIKELKEVIEQLENKK